MIILLAKGNDYVFDGYIEPPIGNSNIADGLGVNDFHRGVSGIDQGRADLIFDLLESGVDVLDFVVSLRSAYRDLGEPGNNRFLRFIRAQHPAALRIEQILTDESRFLTLLQQDWGGLRSVYDTPYIDNAFRNLLPTTTVDRSPYKELDLFLRRIGGAPSKDPDAKAEEVLELYRGSSATHDLRQEDLSQIADIERVRWKVMSQSAQAYLGPEVVAYANNPSAYASFPGQLQLD